ncbi:sensor histidine kinase [Cellulomonas xiejunii]|uniref:histidine kinase n=1 Tax=Cellulomonas xiejunii TaxID=2968083 RepID=A0ABY5KLV4_9CELL|nr:histidine kinase [Cellulomonas xiejunii]MCC2314213.1 histidine kinase [Cellulomonas xiejunii]MCC2319575.1 histidine kinase [Cellulomonas xiejunii]UUI71479.1 histidine kinase [Cellulomonas xiejunii]
MTDATPPEGRAAGLGPRGSATAAADDRSPRPVGRVRARLRAMTSASARTWWRALASMVLVAAFVAWGAMMAVGAESMYTLSRYVGQQQTDTMAYGSALLTLVGAGVLLARHRWPELVAAVLAALAIATLVVAGATNGYELALAAALFAVAAARPPRTTWLVALAVLAPVLVAARLAPRVGLVGSLAAGGAPGEVDAVSRFRLPWILADVLPPSWVITALPVVVLALFGIAFGTLVRTARLRAADLAEVAAARAAEEEHRARVTQADERARVAREMHDVIAHSITVMIALGGGAAAAIDRSPDQARRALDELVDTGRGALGDVRRILGLLHAPDDTHAADRPERAVAGATAHPAGSAAGDDASSGDVPMAPQPGVEDLDRLVERFRTAGLPVRTAGLAVAGLEGLDATVQLAVFRVVQESLTNTLRHAPGTASVDVAVRRLADAVEVVVADRGPGNEDRAATAPVPGSGRGIAGMTGRVAAFGGTLEAGPHLGGWRVRAVLPQPGGTTGATTGATPRVEQAVPATNEGEA